MGDPQVTMGFNTKVFLNGLMIWMIRGTQVLGNFHIYIYIYVYKHVYYL